MKNRLGYCGVNKTLQEQKIRTSRTMRIDKFRAMSDSEQLENIAMKSMDNLLDMEKIFQWNLKHDIQMFRMGSGIVPMADFINHSDLPNWAELKKKFVSLGEFIHKHGMRTGFHPGQYTILVSPKPKVVERSIVSLERHAEWLDAMGLKGFDYPINVHLGGSYGDKLETMKRFVEVWKNRLPDNVINRLVIENDDKPNLYTVNDLMWIHDQIDIPIVFDYFHHKLNPGDLTEEEALKIAISTWPDGIRPLTHYSNSKKIWEDPTTKNPRAHSRILYERIETYGLDFDIEIEAKDKEIALMTYLKNEKA